jgi:hypothetical protein
MKKKEFRFKEYLIGKLRSATRGHPRFTEAKEKAKVKVKVVYNPGDSFVTVTPEKGKPFKVKIYKKMANRDRVMYRCAECGRLFFDYMYLPTTKKGVFKKRKMVAIDHISPIILPEFGFQNWQIYIERLFDGELQILCNYPGEVDGVKSCHAKKTAGENAQRKSNRLLLKNS